ncbi:hypothetical protein N7539_004293 [Penicillium diatomitis]|uniref:Uncharacterized protein n=1 Tax=Penicillium diatomitis TaxID=2819901 RepID=A0A9X0BYH4_9EURO|nr:uncharacterized protein N7539_004293 [Penicillium diatomitis]KAJ5489403.1 hypothetical protein N7539_004293 [Penicillium diatomitis]
MQHISINIGNDLPATRDLPAGATVPDELPAPKEVRLHPTQPNGGENASIYFVGTATTIMSENRGNARANKSARVANGWECGS